MNFTSQQIEQLAEEYYGLKATAKSLNGYDEINYFLIARDGKKYIAKIATEKQGRWFLDAQIKIIDHLNESPLRDRFQHYLLNKEGNELTEIILDKEHYYFRLLTFLEGNFWVELREKPESLHIDLGNFLGNMDKSLRDFSHPGMHRRYTWDISTAMDANARLKFIKDHEKRRIADYFLMQFEREVQPMISLLRYAYIHNDANDYNVLVQHNKVCGLIDFGDMVYTALINSLAVACTYVMLNNETPLDAASAVIKGYHSAYPLLEEEVDILYYLIAARLCISVTQSAFNESNDSGNEHHFITQKPAWDLLYKLIRVNPVNACDRFRRACGFKALINESDHAELLKQRKERIGRNLSISYSEKLKIEKGALQYLYDDKGRTFIDCVNNVSHVGHCHPVVVRAIQKQSATLNTNTRYLHDHLVKYAERLTSTLPSSLKVCYFTNSGSEANDLAVRISRHFTKQKDIIVLDHAYHGTTTLAMEMSPYKFDGKGGFGQKPYIHKAMNPDLYRGKYRYADQDAGRKYAADVQRIIEELKMQDKAPAAFICETLLGVGGQIPLPPEYLSEVYKYVREAGGVCIADEVQVGFGRVGEKFWGFELQGVVPDMVVMGKPIGNGHPLAAVVVTEKIAAAFDNGMEYFNTYGGNPVSMAVGLAVLDVIEGEELRRNALDTGEHLLKGLRRLKEKYSLIGDVRGHGLFIGAELITDHESLQPAVDEINIVVEKMKDRGFLLSTDGPLHNVLKIKPPLVFSKENADEMVSNLDEVLREL